MTLFLIILGCLCILIGLVGCVIPGVAGPPFSFLALIFMSIAKRWEAYSLEFLLAMAGLTVAVTALDYVLPAAGAKKYGASRAGFWGAVVGMLLGLFYAPPLGLVLGAFLWAFLGEVLAGKAGHQALKAGWGVFVGVMVGMLFKLTASGIMTFYFVKALF